MANSLFNKLSRIDNFIHSGFAALSPIRAFLLKFVNFELVYLLVIKIEDTFTTLSDLPQIKENEYLIVFTTLFPYIIKFPLLKTGESIISAFGDAIHAMDTPESDKNEHKQLGDEMPDKVFRRDSSDTKGGIMNDVPQSVSKDETEVLSKNPHTLDNPVDSKDKVIDDTARVKPAKISYTIESIMTSSVTDYRGLHSAILGYLLRKNGKQNNAHDLAIVHQWLHKHSCLTTNEHTEFLEALNSDKPKIFVPAKTTFSGAESDIETWLGMTSIEKHGKAFTYVTEYYKLDDYFGSYLNTIT